jgi:flagellin
MAVVNTNISASIAQSALMKNDRALGKAMEQLSTGSQINSAADDAAGLAISTRMTSQINGLNVGIKNANDGISMLNTADGALVEVTNMLQRMRELALEASNGTTDTKDRTYLNKEYSQLLSEIERVATKTEWNGRTILDDTADGNSSGLVEFQIGVDTGTTLAVDFGDLTQATGTMVSLASSTIAASSTVSAQLVASSVIGKIDTAIDNVNLQRATLGAATNRLTHTVDNLTNVVVNAESTRSAIQDTDYAAATSELARSQIIAQAGTAMLAQANQMPQTVLALLR